MIQPKLSNPKDGTWFTLTVWGFYMHRDPTTPPHISRWRVFDPDGEPFTTLKGRYWDACTALLSFR